MGTLEWIQLWRQQRYIYQILYKPNNIKLKLKLKTKQKKEQCNVKQQWFEFIFIF